MKYLIFALFSLEVLAAAPTYDLNIKVRHGNHVITPVFEVKDNERATMIREQSDGKETFVDVTAHKEGDSFRLKFAVGDIVDGERLVRATPEMLVKANTAGEFTSNNEDEGGEIYINAVAKDAIDKEETAE